MDSNCTDLLKKTVLGLCVTNVPRCCFVSERRCYEVFGDVTTQGNGLQGCASLSLKAAAYAPSDGETDTSQNLQKLVDTGALTPIPTSTNFDASHTKVSCFSTGQLQNYGVPTPSPRFGTGSHPGPSSFVSDPARVLSFTRLLDLWACQTRGWALQS